MNEHARYEMSDDVGFTFGNCKLCGETMDVVNSFQSGSGRMHATCKDPRAVHECVEDNQGLCHRCGRVLNHGRWKEYAGAEVKTTRSWTWLVGEHNPYSRDPENALYPLPDGATGARLCATLGLTCDDYLRRFKRWNLLQDLPWSAKRAKTAAQLFLPRTGTMDRLVLLGAKVAAAFGGEYVLDMVQRRCVFVSMGGMQERQSIVVPHPSGRSRAWNDPEMRRRVREAVLKLDEVRP